MDKGLELRRLCPPLEGALVAFFDELARSDTGRFFHPHAFSAEEARRIAHDTGPDLYYALVEGERVLGYGMLRGWAAGYAVPSLGLVIHPEARGLGLGETFMHFLHGAAARRGATRVRLKVYPQNGAALALYEKLGYRFADDLEDDQLVGVVELGRSAR